MFINRRASYSCSKMNYYVTAPHYLLVLHCLWLFTQNISMRRIAPKKCFAFNIKPTTWSLSISWYELTLKNYNNCKNKQHVQVGTSKFCEASIQRKRTVYKTKMLSTTFHSANTFCLIIHFLDLVFLQSHLFKYNNLNYLNY